MQGRAIERVFHCDNCKKVGILLRPAQTSKRGIKSIWESFEGNILAWIIDYLRTLVE